MWFDNCIEELESSLQNLLLKKTSLLDVLPLHQKSVEGSHLLLLFSYPYLFRVPSFFVWFSGLEILKHVIYAEIQSIFRPYGDSQRTLYLKGWRAVWYTIEKIYTTAVDYGNLWKEEKKGQGKRRALSELLKLLENNGLSRHKSAYTAV